MIETFGGTSAPTPALACHAPQREVRLSKTAARFWSRFTTIKLALPHTAAEWIGSCVLAAAITFLGTLAPLFDGAWNGAGLSNMGLVALLVVLGILTLTLARSAFLRFRDLSSGKRTDSLTQAGIDVSPYGISTDARADRQRALRQSIEARTEGLFSTLAFRAAARGVGEVEIADRQGFSPRVRRELELRFPLSGRELNAFLESLHLEIQCAAIKGLVGGPWGTLRAKEGRLVVVVGAKLARHGDEPPGPEPGSRPDAL